MNGPQLDNEGRLKFPCRYPVKAMTRAEDSALEQVLSLIQNHSLAPERDSITLRPSRNGRYQSITIVVRAPSRARLEALYRSLRALDVVVMTL